ncbi:MAG: DUF2889 domain-containing protein [Pseudomonadota bacterium]
MTYYPTNPSYGGGTFRRRIVLSRQGSVRSAELLDDCHEMTISLRIEGGTVTEVTGRMDRFPRTTCPGAVAALKGALLGIRTDAAPASGVDRRVNCTHLVDLAALALEWHGEDGTRQVIEAAVTDRDAQDRQDLRILVDGVSVLHCELQDDCVVSPEEHRGRRMFGGFARWVDETFAPAEARLWRVAQMALFVSVARSYIVDAADQQFLPPPSRKGSCYSLSDPAFAEARDNVGFVRDFSDGLPPDTALDPLQRHTGT